MTAEIDDKRQEHEQDGRIFVVMHDKFMSGWRFNCPARSLFVVACPNTSLAEQVAYHAENRREEMKRVSIRYGTLKNALSSRRPSDGDHVSIIGVNCHWLGWPKTHYNDEQIENLWRN